MKGENYGAAKRDGERITSLFIDGMDNLGFSEEEILTILRSSLHEKREESE